MAQKGEGVNVVGALSDLLILVLMVGGAGFGGYYLGIHQQLAPVQKVPPGTVGALSPEEAHSSVAKETSSNTPEEQKEANNTEAVASTPTTTKPSASPAKKQRKYWLSSSGVDYIGYSITVKVNGKAVDSFFGPGKNVDITRYVKKGTNTIVFDAKQLGEQYNKHSDDEKSTLVLKVVSGPYVQENFQAKDVLLSYARNAAESQDYNDSKTFLGE